MKASLQRFVFVLLCFASGTALATQERARVGSATLRTAAKHAKAHPDDMQAQLAHAAILRVLFRLDDARERAAAASKLSPGQDAPWIELAMIETLAGRRGLAGSHAQRAVRLGNSAVAKELLAKLGAAVRIGMGKSRQLSKDSRLLPATALAKAAHGRKFHQLSELVRWTVANDATPGLAAAYGEYLGRISGASWLGAEVISVDDSGRARAYLSWRVSPEDADWDAIERLPPGYRAALPLGWWRALTFVEPKLREAAIARARKAHWSEVTIVELEVKDGKVVAVRSSGGDLMAETLPVEAIEVAAPEPVVETSEAEAGRSPKSMDDETFGNRYGKTAPTVGSAYRYQQILLGLAIVLVMLLAVIWLVRREKRKGRAPSR